MGISGLLPALKPLIKSSNIQFFRQKRIAVDTYSWMHKALYGALDDLLVDENSLKWIHYCLKYLDMLLFYEIEVYLVFDGANLPAKARTEESRALSRQKNYELGQQFMNNGDKAQGRNLLARSVDVTPRMAAQFIKICKEYRPTVKCIVAPYEADAQLSFLSRNNIVDCVITEDSDCIPYLCKEIIFKLDNKSGDCEYFKFDEINQTAIEGFDLLSFSPDMLTSMCILSGCDYLASPSGYGMKKSHKLVTKHKTPSKLLRSLKFEGSIPLTNVSLIPVNSSQDVEAIRLLSFEYGFYLALMTFHHQTVFDVMKRQCCPLTDVPTISSIFPAYMLTHLPVDELSQGIPTYFLGHVTSDTALACGIADGLVDPVSKNPFNLPAHMDPILIRSQSNPISTGRNVSLQEETSSVLESSITLHEKPIPVNASKQKTPTQNKKVKNLKDFFTPISKAEKDRLRNESMNNVTVLHRSNTCPTISIKKNLPFATFSSSTSPFESREKKKLSFMESFVQSKKHRVSYPSLTTKESLQRLSERTIAIARDNLLTLADKEETEEDGVVRKQCDVVILSDSEGETEIPDEKLSSSQLQLQSQRPDSYIYSLSPPLTPTGEEIFSGFSPSPISSSSPLPLDLPHSSQSPLMSQSPLHDAEVSSAAVESDVIDDSDNNTTPPRPEYSSLLINDNKSNDDSIDQIRQFTSRKKNKLGIIGLSGASSSSPRIISQPSPVGIDSFLKFQYICK